MTIENQVKSILLDILDLDASELDMDAHLRSGLGATSVDLVEIIAELENQFNLDISEEDARAMPTGNDIVKYIQAKAD